MKAATEFLESLVQSKKINYGKAINGSACRGSQAWPKTYDSGSYS